MAFRSFSCLVDLLPLAGEFPLNGVSTMAVTNMDLRRRVGVQAFVGLGAVSVLITVLLIGCAPKVVRVDVSPLDMAAATQAAKDGDTVFLRKDHYAALIKYLEASRLNPNSEAIQNKLGIAYSQLKFYTEASAAFRRCIALNGKFAFAYNNLGSVYFAEENLRKAEKAFRKAIDLNDKTASFHINLGALYMERKNFEKGMAEWRKGLAIDPNALNKADNITVGGANRSPMERYYFLARLYASLGDVQHAIENLQLALNAGFTEIAQILAEKDFDRIRQDEHFVAFLKNASILAAPPPPQTRQ
jgi:tetratricopeptide (TPR) repeat protein